MAFEVDTLRLLYFVNLHQPIAVADLWSLHLQAEGTDESFSKSLQVLRAEGLLTLDDPTVCTVRGLKYVESVGLSHRRDAGRMFVLKERFRTSTLG